MIERLVILGGTSDVVGRYVAPALAQLYEAGLIPAGFELICVARADWDGERYRHYLDDALAEHGSEASRGARDAVSAAARYHRADTTDAQELSSAFDAEVPSAVYLALPPAAFSPTIRALDQIGLPAGSRIVLEKPFGENLEAARELNEQLSRAFPEDAIHRVDHFLGMHTVQNLLALRFANRLFEPTWNGHHIDRVDIIWDETLTLEGRAGYFDGTGSLKDMIQNHLLQVLTLVAMEAPASSDEQELRGRRVQLLREVRAMTIEEAARHSRRARYTAGSIDGRQVPAYVDEEGVDAALGTETLAEVSLFIDNQRWSGVPFRLRAGKALGADRREVVVHFREVAHPTHGDVRHNRLHVELEPERLRLEIQVRDAEQDGLETIELAQTLPPAAIPAYGRVLQAVLEGDLTLSVRDDEAELAWAIMMPVLDAWKADRVMLEKYPAGSSGPDGGTEI